MRSFKLEFVSPEGYQILERVNSVAATGECGDFVILPRHEDFVINLLPSVVIAVSDDGVENAFFASVGIVRFADSFCSFVCDFIKPLEDKDLTDLSALGRKKFLNKYITSYT